MKLDKKMVNRLLTMNDEQLAEVIRGIAVESGIDPALLGITPGNIQSIRQALGMAQDEDLKKMGEVYEAYRKNPPQK